MNKKILEKNFFSFFVEGTQVVELRHANVKIKSGWMEIGNTDGDCILYKIKGILGMTVNCIWWWGSSSGALRSVKFSFITITPGSTLNRSGSIC